MAANKGFIRPTARELEYTKLGDISEHVVAAYIKEIAGGNIRDAEYEHCMGYVSWYLKNDIRNFIAVISFDNQHCTKNVMIPNKYMPIMQKHIDKHEKRMYSYNSIFRK